MWKCGTFDEEYLAESRRKFKKFMENKRMTGEEFYEKHEELLRDMLVGLKNQYPQTSFSDIHDAILCVFAKYQTDEEKSP